MWNWEGDGMKGTGGDLEGHNERWIWSEYIVQRYKKFKKKLKYSKEQNLEKNPSAIRIL